MVSRSVCASSISSQTFPPQGSPGAAALDLVPSPEPSAFHHNFWQESVLFHLGVCITIQATGVFLQSEQAVKKLTSDCANFTLKQPRKDPWKENKAYACKLVLSFPLPVSLGFGLTLFQGLFLLPCSASLQVVLIFFVSRSPC